ncbi:MAG TPA: isochorismatase family cysteine hydrolase [Candidatus Paceibacterota bacterium]|nr:isochorismatase family cysteine hydrolase [Candidatus Paceibacterota bacterium]
MNKYIFWNVDTMRDFMEKTGALYVKGAEEIIPNLKKLTDIAEEKDITVINSADNHSLEDDEISETPDFINTFPPHCIRGTSGAAYITETEPYKNLYGCCIIDPVNPYSIESLSYFRNIIFLKSVFDTFAGNINTEEILEKVVNKDKQTVVVYGVSGDYCVNYVVKGLTERGYKVMVVLDAIKSLGETPTEEWEKNGVLLTNTDSLLKKL